MDRHLVRKTLVSLVAVAAFVVACSRNVPSRSGDNGGGTSAGGGDNSGGTGGDNSGGTGGDGSGGTGGDGSGGTGALDGGNGGDGSGSGDVDGGSDSDGGFVVDWPSCDAAPPDLPASTLHDVWTENPEVLTQYWVPGVFVTAISGGACVEHQLCEVYLQQAETFPDLASAAQQAIKVLISANAASRFTGLHVGDQVNLNAFAVREGDPGQELIFHIQLPSPGCMKTIGAGQPEPLAVDLNSDLTMDAVRTTLGPVLVHVDAVTGTPHAPAETFGLYETHHYVATDNPVSLSPYCLPGGAFTGLTAEAKTDFTGVTGVFGEFIPTGGTTVYLELYPRSDAEYPVAQVH